MTSSNGIEPREAYKISPHCPKHIFACLLFVVHPILSEDAFEIMFFMIDAR